MRDCSHLGHQHEWAEQAIDCSLSFRYIIEQCKVQCLGQTLDILPAHRRTNFPLATGFQRITPSNASSSYQQSQTGKRGDLSVDVDGAAEVVRQYGVQD